MPRGIVLILFLFSFSSFSQIEEVRRITETLCSEDFHGRGYFKKGDSLAADFLVREFENLGVEPYKQGSFLQPFTIKSVNTFPGEVSLTIGGKILEPGKDFVVDPSSGGYDGELTPLVVDLNVCLDQEKLSKALERILGSTDYNSILLDISEASGDTLKQLAGLPQFLADYIPVIELTNQKFTWSVGSKQFRNALVQLQTSAYASDEEIQLNVDAQILRDYKSQNVIAYIPGKRKCKKTIVFTAHYDHLGRMGASTYFPGANDNASGTAMLFTMAKHFIDNPPEYNVAFIAFAGEEAGLLGSKFYTENPVFPLKKIKFLVNLDIMGSGEEGITVVNSTLFEDEYNLLVNINEEHNLLEKVKKRGPAANSDHYWFTENGVPAFFIYTMGPNKNYHDVFDTYENLSFNEYHDITKLLIEFVGTL